MPHGEQRYFKIKINKALYNHLPFACATTFLRIVPCCIDVSLGFE